MVKAIGQEMLFMIYREQQYKLAQKQLKWLIVQAMYKYQKHLQQRQMVAKFSMPEWDKRTNITLLLLNLGLLLLEQLVFLTEVILDLEMEVIQF